MDNNTKADSPADTTVGNVELIDGHRYRAADGRIFTLEEITDPEEIRSILYNLLEALVLGFIDFKVPKGQTKFFTTGEVTKHGSPFFMDFRRGLLGVSRRGHEDADKHELIEDITDARDIPVPEVSTTAPTEVIRKTSAFSPCV